MGIWSSAVVDHKGIQAAMQDSLALWFNAHILIFSPNSADPDVERYDPYADNDAAPTPQIVFDSGPNGAIIMPSGGANSVDTGGQFGTIGGMQFQTIRQDKEPLPAGLRVRVLDGGNRTSLERFTFSLVDGIGSSIGWGDIIETQVVGNVLLPSREVA